MFEKIPDKPYRRLRNLNSYKRKIRYKQYLQRLADKKLRYPQPAYRIDQDGWYTDDPDKTKYVKREYRGSKSKTLKKISNKKIRRFSGEIPSGCSYKRLFDFNIRRDYHE